MPLIFSRFLYDSVLSEKLGKRKNLKRLRKIRNEEGEERGRIRKRRDYRKRKISKEAGLGKRKD
jgi:hypothetical protein